MTDHTIEKPILFISHATSDADFAGAVQQELERVFADALSVFCTSSPGTIPAGSDWLSVIEQKLETAKAIIAIVTPVSIERPWLWFEIGATWSKGRSGECRIYPLCTPEVELSILPPPLNRLQALSMGRAVDLKLLFQALISQFGFGSISSFRASNISMRIPKYKDVKIVDSDINDRALYSGKHVGYSDDELEEVIDAEFLLPEWKHFVDGLYIANGPGSSIYNGKLIHFMDVDRNLDLPPGAAKRLLTRVAGHFDLRPVLESENLVKYDYTAPK